LVDVRSVVGFGLSLQRPATTSGIRNLFILTPRV
jgi:hypothetical protein